MTSIGGDEPASRVVPAYFFEDGFDLRLPATFDAVLTAPAPLALQQKVPVPLRQVVPFPRCGDVCFAVQDTHLTVCVWFPFHC